MSLGLLLESKVVANGSKLLSLHQLVRDGLSLLHRVLHRAVLHIGHKAIQIPLNAPKQQRGQGNH